MIVVVCGTKGGVGKTTLTVNLAGYRAQAGRSVWVVDGDAQGSAAGALEARNQRGDLRGIACTQYVSGVQLRSQILLQRGHYDDIVIDAGGRDSSALRAALTLADVAVVPFAPRGFDMWALDNMAQVLEEIRVTRDPFPAYLVLNQADVGRSSAYNADAAAAVAARTEYTYLDTPLARRMAFAHGATQGLAVTEMQPRDPKAVAELTALASTLFAQAPVADFATA